MPNVAAASNPVRVPTVSPDKVEEILLELHQRSRLLRLVRMMSREIERLSQDNAQLHAAVKIYREVARQHMARSGRSGQAKTRAFSA